MADRPDIDLDSRCDHDGDDPHLDDCAGCLADLNFFLLFGASRPAPASDSR